MFHQEPNYEPFSLRRSLSRFFHQKSALNILIIINLSVYVGFWILRMFFSLGAFLFNSDVNISLTQKLIGILACPASFHTFLLQPWSMVTNLFSHVEFWHIFFNMIMLWVAGRIFLQYLSEKQLVTTYLIGGVCGNLLYMLSYNFFPVFAPTLDQSMALGASGSIMAILAAITVYKPNHELIFSLFFTRGRSVRLLWITVIFLIIDLLSIPHGNAGGHIAHLGGALYGALYSLLFVKKQWSLHSRPKTKKKKFYTSYTEPPQGRPVSDEDYNFNKKKQEEKLDAILDKISSAGYDALTKEEKDFLFFASKRKNYE